MNEATNELDREQRPPRQLGRDEMNLAEFPISLLTERAPKGQKTLVFEGREGRLTVLGSDAYGLPTALDADVIVGLIQLTKQANDFKDRTVPFSRYGLLRLLGWADRGENYRRLTDSLMRWTTVTLRYEGAWWDNEAKCSLDAAFHILDSVVIVEEETRRKLRANGQQELPFSKFSWNEVFLASCQANNLKSLDLDIYFALNSAVSKRMYRFLDKRFYHKHDWTFDLREFAYGHVGLSRSYADNGILKAKLQPHLEELEAVGVLKPMSRQERYKSIRRGEWTIALTKADTKPQAGPIAMESPAPEPAQPERELTRRGVTAATAAELVASFPAERITASIEVFDWLCERNDKRIARNPAGYLVDSIRKDYAAPKGFISKADREMLEAERRERQRAEVEARRRKAERDARDREEQERITAFLDSLSGKSLADFDAEALEHADPATRAGYEALKGRPFERTMHRRIREAHARRKLGLPAPEDPH